MAFDALNSWLDSLKNEYQCEECGRREISIGDCEICICGGSMFFLRCADSLPGVIKDDLGMRGVVNPIDGKPYDSKSSYYKKLKESGCHIVEKGASTKRQEPDHNVRPELTQAVREVLSKQPKKRKRK